MWKYEKLKMNQIYNDGERLIPPHFCAAKATSLQICFTNKKTKSNLIIFFENDSLQIQSTLSLDDFVKEGYAF